MKLIIQTKNTRGRKFKRYLRECCCCNKVFKTHVRTSKGICLTCRHPNTLNKYFTDYPRDLKLLDHELKVFETLEDKYKCKFDIVNGFLIQKQ